MKRTLMISVATVALLAATPYAMSQGAGQQPGGAAQGAGPAMNSEKPATANPGARGAREHAIPEKQSQGQKGTGSPQSTEAQTHRQPSAQTTGEAEHSNKQGANEHERSGTKQGANEKAEPRNKQGANEKIEPRSKQGANERDRTGTKQGSNERQMTSKNVSLTTEQKTTIREKVLTSSAPRVSGHVNFNIKVGVVVPRRVHVAPLPSTIVEIEPRWRGYMYFVSGDEIIVVEPRTLRIVAVLDV
jgi:hypothetical protein